MIVIVLVIVISLRLSSSMMIIMMIINLICIYPVLLWLASFSDRGAGWSCHVWSYWLEAGWTFNYSIPSLWSVLLGRYCGWKPTVGYWLVVWNMNFMTFPSYWEWNNHPNWRTHIFFRDFQRGFPVGFTVILKRKPRFLGSQPSTGFCHQLVISQPPWWGGWPKMEAWGQIGESQTEWPINGQWWKTHEFDHVLLLWSKSSFFWLRGSAKSAKSGRTCCGSCRSFPTPSNLTWTPQLPKSLQSQAKDHHCNLEIITCNILAIRPIPEVWAIYLNEEGALPLTSNMTKFRWKSVTQAFQIFPKLSFRIRRRNDRQRHPRNPRNPRQPVLEAPQVRKSSHQRRVLGRHAMRCSKIQWRRMSQCRAAPIAMLPGVAVGVLWFANA